MFIGCSWLDTWAWWGTFHVTSSLYQQVCLATTRCCSCSPVVFGHDWWCTPEWGTNKELCFCYGNIWKLKSSASRIKSLNKINKEINLNSDLSLINMCILHFEQVISVHFFDVYFFLGYETNSHDQLLLYISTLVHISATLFSIHLLRC